MEQKRVIESLSLIDAVMPDVVESRKQAAAKNQQLKTEPSNTNGEEGTASISTCTFLFLNKHSCQVHGSDL